MLPGQICLGVRSDSKHAALVCPVLFHNIQYFTDQMCMSPHVIAPQKKVTCRFIPNALDLTCRIAYNLQAHVTSEKDFPAQEIRAQ